MRNNDTFTDGAIIPSRRQDRLSTKPVLAVHKDGRRGVLNKNQVILLDDSGFMTTEKAEMSPEWRIQLGGAQ